MDLPEGLSQSCNQILSGTVLISASCKEGTAFDYTHVVITKPQIFTGSTKDNGFLPCGQFHGNSNTMATYFPPSKIRHNIDREKR